MHNTKKSPLNPINRNQYDQFTIKEFFLNKYSRKELSEFTDEELDNVKNVTYHYNDTIACISQALSVFRVVNFLHESSHQFNIDFYDNEYYTLKYLHNNSLLKFTSVSSLKDNIDHRYIDEIINMEDSVQILRAHSIELLINEIVHRTQSLCLYCAVGYAFKSGLELLLPALQGVLKNGHKAELIVGSLQNYDNVIIRILYKKWLSYPFT